MPRNFVTCDFINVHGEVHESKISCHLFYFYILLIRWQLFNNLCACVGCVQWCEDSSKSPGELNDPLCLWWYVVCHFLVYPSRHVCLCIGAIVWIWYSYWHWRVPQHPVASMQPLNGQWILPVPHWTTSPYLMTNILKFRSIPRTWVQNCTIWLTLSNNWVHWWTVLPVHELYENRGIEIIWKHYMLL